MSNNPFDEEANPFDVQEETPEIKVDENGSRPFTNVGARFASSFASSPEDAVNYLNRKFGKDSGMGEYKSVEFSTHGPLNRLIWKDSNAKTKDGKPDTGWHYVDPNVGWTNPLEIVSDVSEVASDIFPVGLGAAGAIGGGVVGAPSGPGAVATTVAGAGLGSAAGEAVNRGIARALDVTPKGTPVSKDVKDVAIAGALGAGAEFGAPYVVKGAKQVVGKLPKVMEKVPVLGPIVKSQREMARVDQDLIIDALALTPSMVRDTINAEIKDKKVAAQAALDISYLFEEALKDPSVIEKKGQAILDKYGIKGVSQGKPMVVPVKEAGEMEMKPKTLGKSNALMAEFEDFKKTYKDLLGIKSSLQEPPPQVVETLTAAADIPQARELRRKNIKLVADTLDNIENTLAPNKKYPGFPSIPAKGASREELERGLKETFEAEYDEIKNEVFKDSFDAIQDGTSQIPVGPAENALISTKLAAVKTISPEAQAVKDEIINTISRAKSVGELYELKRGELGNLFKSADPDVQRQLSQLYNTLNDAIINLVPDGDLKKDIVQINKLYSDFIQNYGKIADALKRGSSKGGLKTSSIFDKDSVKYLENLLGEKEVDNFFANTLLVYQRILISRMKEKLFKEGFNAETFAKDLTNIARNPKEYAYLREMIDQAFSKMDYGSEAEKKAALGAQAKVLENIMTDVKEKGASGYFVPPFMKKDEFIPKDFTKENLLAWLLRNTLQVGPTPYAGEFVYKPTHFAGRTAAQRLKEQLSNSKKEKK